ncbi:MAG: phenylacetate--CoA ligase family protein, partial [Bacteroidetes bacterium]|nr:phenylacetate--CoA ligase family protein [Bacteroidota bacterium]
YQGDLEKLLSDGYTRKNTYIANTSGSSGHPFFFAKNKEAHAMDWALIKNRYNWHGLKLDSKQARFLGVPLEITSKIKEKIKHYIINRVLFPVFDMSDNALEKFTKKFIKTKFEYIYGYTNSLVLFARYLLGKNIILKNICPTLKCCITTSEVLTVDDRKILSSAFGVRVINEYGSSETGQMAIENDRRDWMLSEENTYFEVLNDELDKVNGTDYGRIVVTDLDNKAMPFIRYKIGDIGVISKELPENGKNRKLEKLLGRENDTLFLPSGKKSPGLTFYYVSRSILESSGVLKEFIIRQTALDTFVFDIVSDRDLFDAEVKEIENKMDMYLEPGLKLEVHRVPKIDRPPSGKIKHFYSELS